MFVLVILGYLIVGLVEIIPLIKKERKKELVLYSAIFLLAFVISLLLSLGVDLPSPATPIENVINFIVGE